MIEQAISWTMIQKMFLTAETQRKDFMLASYSSPSLFASDDEKWNSLVSLTAEVVKALPCLRDRQGESRLAGSTCKTKYV